MAFYNVRENYYPLRILPIYSGKLGIKFESPQPFAINEGLYFDGSYIGDQPTLQERRDDIIQYLHRILQHMESHVIFFDNCDETYISSLN
jgi:hypothetical protein